jgi:hypothetical protein
MLVGIMAVLDVLIVEIRMVHVLDTAAQGMELVESMHLLMLKIGPLSIIELKPQIIFS